MPDRSTRFPGLSTDDVERIRRETYAPLIRHELGAARDMVARGGLADDRLLELLRWLEERAYPTPNTTVTTWVRLDATQAEDLREVLAAEVYRRGGVVTANGFDWVSRDGRDLKAFMPGSTPK